MGQALLSKVLSVEIFHGAVLLCSVELLWIEFNTEVIVWLWFNASIVTTYFGFLGFLHLNCCLLPALKISPSLINSLNCYHFSFLKSLD